MRALTVKNPWAALIALGWKRIENRDWKPPPGIIGTRVAIHAGAGRYTDADDMLEIIREAGDFYERAEPLGLPLTLNAWLALCESLRGRVVATAVLKAVHTSADQVPEDQRGWWIGDYGWELAELQRVEAPAIKGALGLWALPANYFSPVENADGASVPHPPRET